MRVSWLAAVVGGAVMTLTLGSGLFTVETDSVSIPGNQGTSGEITVAEGTYDLQIAQPVGGTCSDPGIAWSDTSIPAVYDAPFLARTGVQEYRSDMFCLRRLDDNVDGDMLVSATVANLAEYDEVCSAGEPDVDMDCGVMEGGTGEISDNVYWSLELDFSSDICTFTGGGSANRQLAAGVSNSFLQLRATDTSPLCVRFVLFTNINEGSPALAAFQTDRAVWDWVLEGRAP